MFRKEEHEHFSGFIEKALEKAQEEEYPELKELNRKMKDINNFYLKLLVNEITPTLEEKLEMKKEAEETKIRLDNLKQYIKIQSSLKTKKSSPIKKTPSPN